MWTNILPKCALSTVNFYVVSIGLLVTKLRTSYPTKITPVLYGLVSHYQIIFICENWVWSYVMNTPTDTVNGINLKM